MTALVKLSTTLKAEDKRSIPLRYRLLSSELPYGNNLQHGNYFKILLLLNIIGLLVPNTERAKGLQRAMVQKQAYQR